MKKNYISSTWRSSKKTLRFLVCAITFSSLLFTGCKKDFQQMEPVSPDVETISKLPSKNLDELNLKLGKIRVVTSSSEMEKGKPVFFDLFKYDQQYRNMVLQALKVTQATCDDNTNLNQWLGRQIADWTDEIIINVLNTDMLNLPLNYTYFFENRSLGQYYGQRGEYTFRLARTFLNLKLFWDIDSRNMVLVGMHGDMMANKAKVYKTYNKIYGLDAADALYFTNVVSRLLKVYPQYRNGNHPIFTFNAFSSPSVNYPGLGVIPAKIVMGDGILEGFKAIGYGDVAPQAILAHEYGHQVQFQLGISFDNTPESTRRTELMADAFSAYYLSHLRGEAIRWGRVKQFLQVFFNIGDCATTSSNHHGTPNQRMASAEWGYEVAVDAKRQLRIISAKEFVSMFDAAYGNILAH